MPNVAPLPACVQVPGGQLHTAEFSSSAGDDASSGGSSASGSTSNGATSAEAATCEGALTLRFNMFGLMPDSLQTLLSSLVPPAARLASLRLHCFRESLDPHAPHGCSALRALTCLELDGLGGPATAEADLTVLQSLLQQCPRLSSLRLRYMEHLLEGAARLPPCLAAHTGLRRLELTYNEMTDLLPHDAPLFQSERLSSAGGAGAVWRGVVGRPAGGWRGCRWVCGAARMVLSFNGWLRIGWLPSSQQACRLDLVQRARACCLV